MGRRCDVSSPVEVEAWFVSLAHNEASVDRTLEAAGEALDEVLG